MIETSTTLILGAGASAPYGFPYGACYKQSVLEALNLSRYDSAWNITTRQERDQVYKKFLNSDMSIDQFLRIPENKSFLDVGKKAIQIAISEHESRSKNNLMKRGPGRWYDLLFNAMLTGPHQRFGDNKISLITFNYDRSLEYFLFRKLKERYPEKSDVDLGKEMINYKGLMPSYSVYYYHVYGLLGFPHFDPQHQHEPSVQMKYGVNIALSKISRGISGIQLVKDPDVLERFPQDNVLEQIKNSEHIAFLGFGFNMDNFGLFNQKDLWAGKDVWVTATGEQTKEREEALQELNLYGAKIRLGEPDEDIYDFLINSGKDIFAD